MGPDTTPTKSIYARGEAFWNNYLKERPSPPESFFDRIFRYHETKGGRFNTVHDAGAGNGPYAQKLRSRFNTVIVSDLAPENVRLAQERLGTDGFRYRAARVEDAGDIPPGSVDLVFATNVLHFADQQLAMQAIADQLQPGGTFVAAGFGPARFHDCKVQDVWDRIMQQAGRASLKVSDHPEKTQQAMERTSGVYNVAPLDERFFEPGAKRIHLNFGTGGLTSLLPAEIDAVEASYAGPTDVVVWEEEEGWSVEMSLEGIKAHFASFPFSELDPAADEQLWEELKARLTSGQLVKVTFSCNSHSRNQAIS